MSESRSEDDSVPDIHVPEHVRPSIESQVEHAQAEHAEVVQPPTRSRGKKTIRMVVFIVIIALAAGGYFYISHANKTADISQLQGKVALSETELRNLVITDHLTVYWAGPLAGAKYTLIATTPGLAYVKYLPGGVGLSDTKISFRVIGTYARKNAFQVSTYTGSLAGNVGFINADGNGVFYASLRPTNVYIGIKGKDIQIEVFDPSAGQALGLVLIRNQIRQIV